MSNTAKADELRAELETKVNELNAALREDAASKTVADKLESADKALKDLNAELKAVAFADLRSNAQPMLKAVELLVYDAASIKRDVNNETKAVSYSIGTKAVRINPANLEDFCKTQIGVTAGWRYRADDFARFLAARKAKEIGADWKEVCEKFKLRTQTERTEIKDPTSMSNLIERLQELVDAMIFVPYVDKDGKMDGSKNQYKVTSKDVAFVLGRAYGDCRKLLTVGTLKKTMDGMLLIAMEVLNHLVFENAYNVDYKSI